MRFMTFIWRNIRYRPIRSSLTILAVAVAIGAVIALAGISREFERSFTQMYRQTGVDIVVKAKRAFQIDTSSLPESIEPDLRKIEGVHDVVPEIRETVNFNDAGLLNIRIFGWNPETVAFSSYKIAEGNGRMLKKDDTKSVMLGVALAQLLNKKAGDTVELYHETYKVVGLFMAESFNSSNTVIMPLHELQPNLGREGEVTIFNIITTDGTNKQLVEEVKKKIEAIQVPDTELAALPTQTHISSITEVQLARGMAWMTSSIALVIGSVGVLNTMIMAVHERTKEIGILRAIGWSRRRIVRMILTESLILSFLGAVVGAITAYFAVKYFSKIPSAASVIGGNVDPIVFVQGFVIAILVGVIGGLAPAISASRMAPTSALRQE